MAPFVHDGFQNGFQNGYNNGFNEYAMIRQQPQHYYQQQIQQNFQVQNLHIPNHQSAEFGLESQYGHQMSVGMTPNTDTGSNGVSNGYDHTQQPVSPISPSPLQQQQHD